ncbi:hypothetical protein J9317_02345 [Metabacillus sp. KIGAM252]|uniref:Uncharacterized protein n=1 Tax=Metabacillus flavus TaxID=2823519 RepID=A0ABS5LAF1_9BACI|nr:hypothetical protein [Metabacillus flavus]MBS2967611.1 hypothetical protein [Metabacillus flavus]
MMALINLGTAESGLALDQKTLIGFSTTILFIGLLVFLVTILRLAILLHKGHYKQGTKKDTLRRKYEKADYIPGAILAGIGIVYFIIFIFTNIQTGFSTLMIASAICILIFFTMMFVLPEQLLLLYCKFKFKSFNFNKRGYLFSEKD